MHKFLLGLLTGLGAATVAMAQGNSPITGYDLSQSVYQTNLLLAEPSVALLPGFAVSAPGSRATLGKPYAVAGQWQGTLSWPFVAIHTSVLPTGKVVAWQGHNNGEQGKPMPMMKGTDVYERDPASATFSSPIYADSNIFCSGHTFLSDGRLFVTGGHDKYYNNPQYIGGINSAFTRNSTTGA